MKHSKIQNFVHKNIDIVLIRLNNLKQDGNPLTLKSTLIVLVFG